jgi:hypothetical protein
MALVLHPLDQVHRKQTDCTIRASMQLEVPLAVPFHPSCRDLCFEYRMLGDAAVRDIDLMHVRIRWSP